MASTLHLHTSTPFMPLAQMIAGEAQIIADRTRTGMPDCMYGWSEPQDRPECRNHFIVCNAPDDQTLINIAATLADLDFEVVVTSAEVWSEVVPGAPYRYEDLHQH